MVARNFITVPGEAFSASGAGAVERTVDDKLSEVVSVKDFGATGNGVTDDTAAIQAALNTQKNVFIPRGNYLISSTLSYTANNQVLVGENFSAINVSTGVPLNNTNMSQIITTSAITMLNMGDYVGTQLKNVCFNGTGQAVNGITIAPSGSPLKFNIVVDNIFINDVSGTALNTGYVVDSTFSRISINGFNEGSSSFTNVGIRVGATNVSFDSCWFHGCKNAVLGDGSIANFLQCTFTNFPYNASNPHIKLGTGVALYRYNQCYFETAPIFSPNGQGIGTQCFTDCFLETQAPFHLFDLNSATSGALIIQGGRLHESTTAVNINTPAAVQTYVSGLSQTVLTFSGAGKYTYLNTKGNSVIRDSLSIDGTYISLATAGTSTLDTSSRQINLLTGNTVDFSNFAGMLLISNRSNGNSGLYLCSAGVVTQVAITGAIAGSTAYEASIDGYRFTAGADASYCFMAFRTKPFA